MCCERCSEGGREKRCKNCEEVLLTSASTPARPRAPPRPQLHPRHGTSLRPIAGPSPAQPRPPVPSASPSNSPPAPFVPQIAPPAPPARIPTPPLTQKPPRGVRNQGKILGGYGLPVGAFPWGSFCGPMFSDILGVRQTTPKGALGGCFADTQKVGKHRSAKRPPRRGVPVSRVRIFENWDLFGRSKGPACTDLENVSILFTFV